MTVIIIDELDEAGPNIDFETGEASLTREVIIAGSSGQDFESLMADLFGAVFVSGLGFVYNWRALHPKYTWMYAASAELVGSVVDRNPPSGSDRVRPNEKARIHYKGLLLSANKDPDDPSPPSGTYLTHSKDFGAEMMTVPDSGVKWASDDSAVANVNAGIVMPTVTHRFTWHGVQDPPWADIEECTGAVNDRNQLGLRAYTCLFLGASQELSYDLDGSKQYTLSYTFAERKKTVQNGTWPQEHIGWLHYYRDDGRAPANTSPWDILKTQQSPNLTLYRLRDFSRLFRLGP